MKPARIFALLISVAISLIGTLAAENTTACVLLSAATATDISISSSGNNTSIIIKNVDNTGNNFYYQAGTCVGNTTKASTQIMFSSITDVTVEETSENVIISFTDSRGNNQTFSFVFADPDNRSVKSYIGKRSSDFGFTIARSGRTEWSVISRGLGLGWNAPLNASPDLNTTFTHSFDITWHMVLGVKMQRRNNSLTFGLGIDWQNYVTHSAHYFHKNADGRISLESYEPGVRDKSSRLKLFALQIPVMYGLRFGHKKHLGFTLGPVINFNTGSSIKTQYKLDGREYSIKTNNIGQRPVTVDAMATFNYRAIGIYVRYSPMKKLRTSADLEFNALSSGLMLCF